MMEPQIVLQNNEGYHNSLDYSINQKKNAYKDLSTICIVPTRGQIPAKVVQNWMGLMTPMNQKFVRLFAIGLEVGKAYDETIKMIINHPELSKWKYILTMEEDNCPPPDGLLKLYESMGEYDAVGGLYWTKGIDGKPMCYGNTDAFEFNFAPFMPTEGKVTRCNGLGMGFTLFKLDMFKNPNLPKPIFETVQRVNANGTAEGYTQDLKFFENAGKLGYKFACDSRVKVGHYDLTGVAGIPDYMW